ncbi:putative alpha-helical protein, potentially involved in replication/repair, partial [Trachipleistophora hominis]
VSTLKEHKLLKSLYEQELERVKYILTDYLRVRLIKLQNNFYVNTEYLSEYEKVFYQKLVEKFKEYDIFTEQNEEYVDFECVGFIALVDIGKVIIDGNSVDVLAGDFFVAQLADVKHLLLDRKIMLV